VPSKVFRNTTYVAMVFIVMTCIAASNTVPDGADWDVKFIAFSSAVTPWMVTAMIVWAAGVIVEAINRGRDAQ
jgi:hypothetical protein